jgi:N-acetylglucosamine malate deacetylase 1
MAKSILDILIIAPHPDDAELGMGGAILKFKSEGLRIGVLDLTSGEPTPFGSNEIRIQETQAATEILGLDWRENLGLPNRCLEHTLEARAQLAGVFRQTRPRWIFAPYWVDAHPDHVAATQLIEAARFWSKLTKTDMPGQPHHPERIFYYYCVHLRIIPQPAFVLDISEFWDRKLAAISCYRSQFIEGRPAESPTFLDRLRDQAAAWGWSIGVKYGEPYASREPIGLGTMNGMI